MSVIVAGSYLGWRARGQHGVDMLEGAREGGGERREGAAGHKCRAER